VLMMKIHSVKFSAVFFLSLRLILCDVLNRILIYSKLQLVDKVDFCFLPNLLKFET
jgi:hypothetical protein